MFTTVTETPVDPVWVVSAPGALSREAIDRIRDQFETSGNNPRLVVLPDGATLYDARVGPPYRALDFGTQEITSELPGLFPWSGVLSVVALLVSVAALVLALQ